MSGGVGLLLVGGAVLGATLLVERRAAANLPPADWYVQTAHLRRGGTYRGRLEEDVAEWGASPTGTRLWLDATRWVRAFLAEEELGGVWTSEHVSLPFTPSVAWGERQAPTVMAAARRLRDRMERLELSWTALWPATRAQVDETRAALGEFVAVLDTPRWQTTVDPRPDAPSMWDATWAGLGRDVGRGASAVGDAAAALARGAGNIAHQFAGGLLGGTSETLLVLGGAALVAVVLLR